MFNAIVLQPIHKKTHKHFSKQQVNFPSNDHVDRLNNKRIR